MPRETSPGTSTHTSYPGDGPPFKVRSEDLLLLSEHTVLHPLFPVLSSAAPAWPPGSGSPLAMSGTIEGPGSTCRVQVLTGFSWVRARGLC